MKRLWTGLAAAALCAGAWAVDEGVTDTEIRLGASVALTGPIAAQTADYGSGARLLFDAVNAAGGVNGRRIVYKTVDDGFEVPRAVENTRKLIREDKVFMVFQNTGTAHTEAILPLLRESRTIAFGPVSGASSLRDKFNPYLFHVRAGQALEARHIVRQLKQLGMSRVAAFYQDDPLGNSMLDEVRKAAKAEGLALVAEPKLDPNVPDMWGVADATAQAKPQAVIVASAGTTFTQYIRAMRDTTARPTFYGFSIASAEEISREIAGDAKGIVLAQTMPSVRNVAVPLSAEYLQLLKAKDPAAKPSTTQFDGFVHAKVLVEGLRRAGRQLNAASFTKAMESSGDLRYGHFSVRYGPESHNGSSYVELAIIDGNGQLRY